MARKSDFKVFSVSGFDVRLDASWFILFFLILWTFSAGVFPAAAPGLGLVTYVVMGLVGTVLLFASLLVHELSHSFVARTRGIAVRGITLFIFGGLAHTTQEPKRPQDELAIAGVGPLVSLLIGGALLGFAAAGRAWQWSPAVHEVPQYVGFMNVALAVFNILPGFPLDGGRVLRALVWRRTGDYWRATRWATNGGRWLGLAMIVVGAFDVFGGALIGGLWLLFIGIFLRGAAGAAQRDAALTRALTGVPAGDVMASDPVILDAGTSLREAASGPLVRSTHSAFPVRDGGRIVGVLTLDRLGSAAREEWASTTVGDVMRPLDDRIVVHPDTAMEDVLVKVRAADSGEVFVVDSGTVVGSISQGDLARLATRAGELSSSRS